MSSAAGAGARWEPVHEELLSKWKAQCFVDMWLQSESAYMYWRLYNWLSYPVIVLTTLGGAALFGSTALVDSYVVNLAIGSMTTAAALLTTVIRQVKPAELAQTHTLSAKRYQILIRAVDGVLSQPESLRPDPQAFLQKVQGDMDTLLSSQEEVPRSVRRQFERVFGSMDVLLYGADIVALLADGQAVGRRLLKDGRPLPAVSPSLALRRPGAITLNGAATDAADAARDVENPVPRTFLCLSEAMPCEGSGGSASV